MKGNVATMIAFALCVVYLLNTSLLISTMDTTQQSPLLPPTRSKALQYYADTSNKLPVYTNKMAAQAIRPAPWICGNRNDSAIDPLTQQKPLFAFVHIYKTAGSTVRTFFQAFAYTCRKGWMCMIGCTKVMPFSLQSKSWDPCRVKNIIHRNRITEEVEMNDRGHHTVNNTIVRDNIDIYGGHFRIGTGDYVLTKNQDDIYPTRHIIFLRDPMERFVSGILYERRKEEDQTLLGTVELIKKRIRGSRAAGRYWEKSLTYLLTPSQAEEFENKKSEIIQVKLPTVSSEEQLATVKAVTAIHNLKKYNVIVGMTERMRQSMDILKHVLLSNASSQEISKLDELTNAVRNNESKNGEISTSSVLSEIRRDLEFMTTFEEYVKYEKMIHNYAMHMHLLQHKEVVKATVISESEEQM